jgi:hypothetical protein
MSQTLSSSVRPAPASGVTSSDKRLAGWLREPLVHFLIAGALLFAVDGYIASRTDNPNVITLSTDTDAELHKLFSDDRGREPTAEELGALRQRWFDNELLYREGLALGLDRGDTGIRERVIFKALNVVQANLAQPEADEQALAAYFEANRARYDEPARVDLLEAVVPGQPARAMLDDFAAALNAGRADTQNSGLRIFRGRPLASIREAFGAPFVEALERLPMNTWAVLEGSGGPRVVSVEARKSGRAVGMEEVRERVQTDWQNQRMAQMRTEAVRKLADKYTLRVAAEQRR